MFLLTEFPALNAGAAKQFAVLFLRHALAALFDDRTHGVSLTSQSVMYVLTCQRTP